MFWLIIIIVVVILTVIWTYRRLSYWSRRGVCQNDIGIELGLLIDRIQMTRPEPEWYRKIYCSFKDQRYFGMYIFFRPALFIRDPELIKQITVSDFDHFMDRTRFRKTKNDPLWEKNLLTLKGNDWREMRSLLTPVFTGTKLKIMFDLMSEVVQQFTEHFETTSDSQVIEFDASDIFNRFACDVIASTAFGVTCNSLEDRNNEFYLIGEEILRSARRKYLPFMIIPFLTKLLGLRMTGKKVETFFRSMIRDNLECRKGKGIVRYDLIHLLGEAQQDSGKNLTENDMIAQAFLFYTAGFTTVSTALSFMAYELALHPDIQKKLQREIDETLLECKNGDLTFDVLSKMRYMDMVTSETLRKWPSIPNTIKFCTKAYTIEPARPNERVVHLNVGDVVVLPCYAIQRDPKYYPKPECFDPERFRNEKPCTYAPFGMGPRHCIGNRFALLEVKLLFFHLLLKFELVVVTKTKIPPELARDRHSLSVTGELWLGLKSRK